jgi:hypothetical protein
MTFSMSTPFSKEFIKKVFTVRRAIILVIGLFSIGLILVIWPSPPPKSQLKIPTNLQAPPATPDSSNITLPLETFHSHPIYQIYRSMREKGLKR